MLDASRAPFCDHIQHTVNIPKELRQSTHAACLPPLGATQRRPLENLSAFFPDVASACSALGHRDAILDGEIIVMDDHGRPSFQLLQRRLQTPRPGSTLQRRLPARLVVFDVLHLDGFELTRQPYRERRHILQDLDLEVSTPGLATSPAWFGVDGTDVLKAMVAAGMEGVVCKAIGSSYQAGRRSRQWIKTPYRHSGHVVVGGYVFCEVDGYDDHCNRFQAAGLWGSAG